MENIKNAFHKVKQDISSLRNEIDFLKLSLVETREKIIEMCDILKYFNKEIKIISQPEKSDLTKKKGILYTSTDRHIIPTDRHIIPTQKKSFKPLKHQNPSISTGNRGASTDRQTDRQTDRHTKKTLLNNQNSIEDVLNMIDSLDNVKKEIRLKFKRLTDQEILVFSSIYQLDEEIGYTDYKTLSRKLNLTESSIRDYVLRLIKKGIPVEKKKINNKNIELSISQNFKKVAALSTILQLRDL